MRFRERLQDRERLAPLTAPLGRFGPPQPGRLAFAVQLSGVLELGLCLGVASLLPEANTGIVVDLRVIGLSSGGGLKIREGGPADRLLRPPGRRPERGCDAEQEGKRADLKRPSLAIGV